MWTSTIIVTYLLSKRAHAQPLVASQLHDIIQLFFWLGIVSLAVVLGTGGLRFLYYKPARDGSEPTKKILLIAKHVFFTVVFAGGTFLAYRWTYC